MRSDQLRKRLEEAERAAGGPGQTVCLWRDETPVEEWPARLAEAHKQAGPAGTVILVEYEDLEPTDGLTLLTHP